MRAMEIIDELEPTRRGTYGGAVGYFSFNGNMDFCITIRTMLLKDGKVSPSRPAPGSWPIRTLKRSIQETLNKAARMMQAIAVGRKRVCNELNKRRKETKTFFRQEGNMILMIDNYDSFTYNLVQYLGQLGEEVAVHRNDEITLEEIEAMEPEAIFLSPGPCTPKEAGVTVEVVRRFHQSASPSWASAWVTRPSAMPSAAMWSVRRGSCTARPRPF